MRSENELGNISCKITNIRNVSDSIYISFEKETKDTLFKFKCKYEIKRLFNYS